MHVRVCWHGAALQHGALGCAGGSATPAGGTLKFVTTSHLLLSCLSPPLSLSLPWCSINTPARSRGALGNNRNREVDLTPSTGDELNRASSTDAGLTSDVGPISRTVIWGTDVNVQDTQDKFTNFFTTFLADNQDEPKYLRLLAEVCTMPPNPPSLSLV